jgi:hypothetical protein
LEVGTWIAKEMLDLYKEYRFRDSDYIVKIEQLLETKTQKNIDKAIWRLMFINCWRHFDKPLFSRAQSYILLPLKMYAEHRDVLISQPIKKTIERDFELNGRLLPEAKREIEAVLASMGPGMNITVDNQMANLMCLISTAFSITERLGDWPRMFIFYRIILNVCEIKPYGKALFSKEAYLSIWKD